MRTRNLFILLEEQLLKWGYGCPFSWMPFYIYGLWIRHRLYINQCCKGLGCTKWRLKETIEVKVATASVMKDPGDALMILTKLVTYRHCYFLLLPLLFLFPLEKWNGITIAAWVEDAAAIHILLLSFCCCFDELNQPRIIN